MISPFKQSPETAIAAKAFLRFSSALFLVFFVSPGYGQAAPETQSPPAALEQDSGIRTNVDEVSLDLVVHDRGHNAVLNLKPEDLVVTDDGTPVKLTGFHLVSGEAAASRGHMVTFLFDSFHGPTAKSARIIVSKILSALPASGYTYAVLDFTNRLRLMQGFTENRDAVQQAFDVDTESKPIVATSMLSASLVLMDDKAADEDRAKMSSAAEKSLLSITQKGADTSGRSVGAKERSQAQTLLTAMSDSQAILQEQHAQLNLAALLALVKSQQGIGERKALIYFTLNQQLDPKAKKMLEGIADAATRAGVSIYAIDMDALGNSSQYQESNALLNGQPPFNPTRVANSPMTTVAPMLQEAGTPIQGAPSPTGPVWGVQQDIQVMTDFMRSSGEDRTNPFADTKSPMAGLAKATGGGYIDALNNIKRPLQQLVQDLTTYYQASYAPPFKEYDGKFRTIAVKPVHTGLNIQTRKGYFAVAPGEEAGIRSFEGPLLKSLTEPQLPNSLKFQDAILRFGDLPDGNANSIAIEVRLAELTANVDPHSNLSSAHVSIVAQIKDMSGTVVEHYSEDVTTRGVAEALNRDGAATISMVRHFMSVPGKYTMEVAVLDQNSGKAGARRTEFEIPDLTGVVSLSDMALVRRMDGADVDGADPLEPLRYQDLKVTPNVARELPQNSKGASLFFILHPDPASSEPMKLEMELVHNGTPGHRTALLEAGGMHAPVPYLANIGTKTLPPGNYEVRAYLSQGGKTAEQSETFKVEGTARASEATPDANWFEGASMSSDAGDKTMQAPPRPPGQLVIQPSPTPVPAPSQDDAVKVIQAAREQALSYNDLLPNFTCTEVTQRAVDRNGDGRWRLSDTLVESLSFRDRLETRTTLEVNGIPSDTKRQALKGTFSAGEFGGVLQAVFRDASKADFKWKETELLKEGTVQVYDYRVDRGDSSFSVTGSNGKQLVVGFHGQVFIDSATHRARRITLAADDLPAGFPTRATSLGVDYDYVPINGLRYLMPVSAELQLKQGQHEALVNTMEFRDYKRFGSSEKTLGPAVNE